MKTSHLFLAALGFSLSLIATNAHAVEVMSSEELKEHCDYIDSDPKSEDAVFCIRYIQGFIDGAVATDGRVTQNVVDEYERAESFTERAMRTRGVNTYIRERMDRLGPSAFAEFCLGDPVPLREVVDVVIGQLENPHSVKNFPQARDLVYAALRINYPCQAD